MMHKVLLGMCAIILTTHCIAETHPEKINQEQFDQKIQMYTDQVNATKHILDEENVKVDSTEQRKAFCSRVKAYQAIAELSQQNIGLDTANMMLIIANNFLDRQNYSIEQSGMTLDIFCSGKTKK